MRKLAIVAALASSAIAAPALARDGAWYVSVDGGGLFVEDIHYKLPNAQSARLGNKAGYDVDANVGYDFGPFRVEGEAAYKSSNNKNFSVSGPNGGSSKNHGSTDVLSFMLNGMFDFGGKNDGVSGFIGGGVGVARVALDHYSIGGGRSFANDNDAHFAWQVIAGIRKPITKMIDFELKYRFFNVNGLNFRTTDMGNMSGRYRSHSALAGLVFNFGEPKAAQPAPPPMPAPPPPTPPAPPPPEEPPAPPAPAIPGPFLVFFDFDKYNITPEAASILDNVASSYAQTGQARVVVAGYTDTKGPAKYNMGLSQRRADSVKAYLVGKGVPDDAMATEAYGKTHLLVQTADGVREPQNRRVEITFGPGSDQ